MLNPREDFTAIKPRGNMILAEAVGGPKCTEAGIELPDGYEEGPPRLRILAVGPGNRTRDGKGFIGTGLNPGDIVGHGASTAVGVMFNGRPLMLLNADAIICVFDEKQIQSQIKVVQ